MKQEDSCILTTNGGSSNIKFAFYQAYMRKPSAARSSEPPLGRGTGDVSHALAEQQWKVSTPFE